MVGDSFDAIEYVELPEEEAKSLIEKYNKEAKEAGFGQQPEKKRSRFEKAEHRDGRNNRDSRDSRDGRRSGCEYIFFTCFQLILHFLLYLKSYDKFFESYRINKSLVKKLLCGALIGNNTQV